MESLDMPTSWRDLAAGFFGLPSTATHFRWSNNTSEREKPCDGGRYFDLADVTDRPQVVPRGPVRVYPFTYSDEQNTYIPIVVSKGKGGNPDRRYIVLTFTKIEADPIMQQNALLEANLKLLKLAVTPNQYLIDENKRLRDENQALAELVEKNKYGVFERLLLDHPDAGKGLLMVGIQLLASIKASIDEPRRDSKVIESRDEKDT